VADGDAWSGPDGYAHDDDYVHDNVPISEDEVSIIFYDSRSCGCDLDGALRDSEYTSPDGGVNNIPEADDTGDVEWPGDGLPDDELFVKRVEYSGDEVTVSVAEQDGTGFQVVHTWTGLEGYGELYYSSYE